MGFRGGVKLTPPQHILVFKYPSRDMVKELGPMKIKPTLVGFRIRLNVELPIFHHENPPNRILSRFFELNSVENNM